MQRLCWGAEVRTLYGRPYPKYTTLNRPLERANDEAYKLHNCTSSSALEDGESASASDLLAKDKENLRGGEKSRARQHGQRVPALGEEAVMRDAVARTA